MLKSFTLRGTRRIFHSQKEYKYKEISREGIMKKAFTFIELVVVVALIAILVSVASLSASNIVEKNNFKKMKTIIPAVFRIYTEKLFNDGEDYTITLDIGNSKFESEEKEQELPNYYTYSVYTVIREYDSTEGEHIIKSASLLSNSASVDFITSGDGRFDGVKLTSAGTATDTTILSHPAIIATKASDSTVAYKVDIIPNTAMTRVITYTPNGATLSDVGDKDKWVRDDN